MLWAGCRGRGIGATVQLVPFQCPDSGSPPAVLPTAVHEPGAVQETLVNGLDRRSTFQIPPFQPMISDPTAVQLVAVGHDTLSSVPSRPSPGDGTTCHTVPSHRSISVRSGPLAVW